MTQRTPEEMMNLILSVPKTTCISASSAWKARAQIKHPGKTVFRISMSPILSMTPRSTPKDDTWVNVFGERLIMQKARGHGTFPHRRREGYSFLMFFTDYNKIDLTILPLTALEDYLNGDGLREIFASIKTVASKKSPTPTDKEYHIQSLAPAATTAATSSGTSRPMLSRGLCRRELLFAIDLLAMMRNELLRMLSWQVGSAYGFTFSVGKNYKFIDQYLPAEQWQALLSTYRTDSVENTWRSLSPATNSFEMPLKISLQNTATPIPITTKTSPATSAICTRNTKQK